MISTCPQCKGENLLRGKAFTIALTCAHCNAYYVRGSWRKETVKFNEDHQPSLPIGTKGRIADVLYEVMGFVVKKEKQYKYLWREYLLFNPFKGYAFLSEYDGHWNFIWPIDDTPPPTDQKYAYDYEGQTYNLYQHYSAKVVFAQGEFFFDVVDITESTHNREYISPPFVYGVETSDDSLTCFKGEYITPKAVADAFKLDVKILPLKSGVGYTQPVMTSFSMPALIRLSFVMVIVAVAIQLFFNSMAEEKQVFQGQYRQGELTDQKFFKTESFNLTGYSKSVEIDLWAPINNDWFAGEFSLINETDGTEYVFTKEIEFYAGSEDGYAWTEGEKYGEAFISAVPEGRYHVNIYPEFSGSNQEFTIRVIRDVPTNMNFFLTAVALALVPIIVAIRRRIVEAKRWKDSDYSPYHS
jgi:hypothetical protein